ncbi:CPBP family intramembrane glutamic endopeptidase [Leptothoe sp. PORK10 BA2]|uniref:CPBP family intramembrane glutamic endopeptidase n=1 Tax=Leptothoe sp. PORK10 BA2 TaxID=3110254 RepID=UPI003FA35DEA
MNQPVPPSSSMDPLTRTQVLVAIAATALVLFLIARLWLLFDTVEQLPSQMGFYPLTIGLLFGVGITAASGVLYRLWPAYRRSAEVYLDYVLKPLVLPDVVWLGLLPGISEELLFRGVMLPALGANAWALVLSSLCFGLLHMSDLRQWPYMLWATCVGALLGYSALATQNLLVPVVAHVFTNLLSSLVWKLKSANLAAR